MTGARSGESVAAPARVDFRDGAVSQLGAPLDGRIVKVNAQIGQRVTEGDALLTLDCPDAAEMRAAVASATASLREARSALDRQNRMMQQGVGTERDRIAAETRVSAVEAELSRVQADVTFVGTLDGSKDLEIQAGFADTLFNDNVGTTSRIGDGAGTSILLDSKGLTTFNKNLSTKSGMTATGPVTFNGNVALGYSTSPLRGLLHPALKRRRSKLRLYNNFSKQRLHVAAIPVRG